MEKPSARAERSRSALRNALRCLLQERNYDEIPITHVTRKAHVGYTTFYRHYDNFTDLLVDLLHTNAHYLISRLRREATLYDESVILYGFVRSHEDIVRTYLQLPERHPARHAARNLFYNFIVERYAARKHTDVPYDLTINHLLEATHQMIFFYLERLDQYEPEDIAQMHISLVVRPTVHFTLDVREDWQEHHSVLEPA